MKRLKKSDSNWFAQTKWRVLHSGGVLGVRQRVLILFFTMYAHKSSYYESPHYEDNYDRYYSCLRKAVTVATAIIGNNRQFNGCCKAAWVEFATNADSRSTDPFILCLYHGSLNMY